MRSSRTTTNSSARLEAQTAFHVSAGLPHVKDSSTNLPVWSRPMQGASNIVNFRGNGVSVLGYFYKHNCITIGRLDGLFGNPSEKMYTFNRGHLEAFSCSYMQVDEY